MSLLLLLKSSSSTWDPSDLLTGLVAWWPLDETSGTRYDAHTGSLDLSDNNTVGYTTGKKANAASFVYGNSESLSRASEAALQVGSGDWTAGFWLDYSTDGASGEGYFLGKYPEWGLRRQSGASNIEAYNTSGARTGAALGTGWHFHVAWYDSGAGTLNVQTDDGTVNSSSLGATTDGSADFVLGGIQTTGTNYFLTGYMDEAFLFSRVLTAEERTWLYNSGNGRTYTDFAGAAGFRSFLAFWAGGGGSYIAPTTGSPFFYHRYVLSRHRQCV